MRKDTFYITTAIDYPNGNPHVGHAFEKIIADTYARWARFLGKGTQYLTGTDENGQKLMLSAKNAGASSVMAFVDENVDKFKGLISDLKISNTDFIRTTESRHLETARFFWMTLEEKGDIYFGTYAGNYCFDCEQFYPDNQAEDGNCPSHGKPLVHVEEEGYFFRMSKYADWIKEHIETHEEFLFPSSARKEMLGRLESDKLADLAVSRKNEGWGIEVPGNSDHVMYTWFDALMNYYAPVHTGDMDASFWPCDVHVIGKDITWFHGVVWPIMLKAAGIDIPKTVHVHGMILDENGKKMSKSLGNVIDPAELTSEFPNDTIRYYLLRNVSSGQDGKMSIAGVKKRHNGELANELGNLVNRAVKLSLKKISETIDVSEYTTEFRLDEELVAPMKKHMEKFQHHLALDHFWQAGVVRLNTYLNEKEPWRIKDDPKTFADIMVTCLHGVYVLGVLAKPFMPEASDKILAYLGRPVVENLPENFDVDQFTLSDPKPLFMRLD